MVSWIIQKKSTICRRRCAGLRTTATTPSPDSPPRSSERHAIYILNLQCPLTAYDITFDPRKTLVEFTDWAAVLKVLRDLIYNFLRSNNLLAQEDTYQGAKERCTFADPVLQDVLEGDTIESGNNKSPAAVAPSNKKNGSCSESTDERSTRSELSKFTRTKAVSAESRKKTNYGRDISAENTLVNLQSKNIRRPVFRNIKTADAPPEKTVISSVGEDEEMETSMSDVPGAQLAAAAMATRLAKNSDTLRPNIEAVERNRKGDD